MSQAGKTFFLLALLALALALPAAGDPRTLTLDPESTEVSFSVAATGHDVHGKLYLTEGRLALEPATGTATGELKIDATTAETGNKKRDKAMRKKVLESESHPWIVFRAESLEGSIAESGVSEIRIHGSVTIDGAEHPLTLAGTLEVDGGSFTGRTTFSVPYVDWGMHQPGMLFLKVAPEVEVTVAAAGTVSSATVAGAADGAEAAMAAAGSH